jgi:hypothetical protein
LGGARRGAGGGARGALVVGLALQLANIKASHVRKAAGVIF